MASRPLAVTAALLVVGMVVGAGGCTDSSVSPTPNPTPSAPAPVTEVPGSTRGASEGETSIWLLAAEPAPGAALTGCGGGASGCGGRIRMTLRLVSPAGGPALGLLARLHSDRATACFVAVEPAFVLPRGTSHDVGIVFEPADTDEACFTPLDLTHLAVVVEGSTTVFGRQEWALRYHLAR